MLLHLIVIWVPSGQSLVEQQAPPPKPLQGQITETPAQLSTKEPAAFSAPETPTVLAEPPAPEPPETSEPSNQEESRAQAGFSGPPEFENEFTPYYPLHLLAKGTRGSVSVEFSIGADGAPVDIAILGGSSEAAFQLATLSALELTRFSQAGRPRGLRYVLTVTFDPQGLVATSSFDKPN